MSAYEHPPIQPKHSSIERSLRIARWLLPFYIAALVLSAPLVLGLFAYGLAHAGSGAIASLLAGIAVVFVLAAAPPLVLLSKSNTPAVIAFKVLGGSVMLAGTVGMLALLNFWWLEPQWMKVRFRHALSAVEVHSVAEEPIEMQGRVIGLKILREVDLKREVALDEYGAHVLEILKHVTISPIDAPADAQPPFDMQAASRLLTIDGKPVDASFDDLTRGAAKKLAAGRYKTEHILLLSGLRSFDWPQPPCRDERLIERAAVSLEKVSGHALKAQSFARLSYGSRRGYDWRSVRAMPLNYRYEHSSWMRGIRQLSLDTCQQRDERERAAREEQKRVEIERQYAEGESRLAAEDNPLVQEMCANDLAAVRARLERGAPAFNLSGAIVDCTITKSQPEMFGVVMPALYARAQERSGYCSVLRTVQSQRALAHLEKLAEVKLPLVCADAEDPPPDYWRESCTTSPAPYRCIANAFSGEHVWRAGLYPSDASGHVNRDPASPTDTLQWLQLLHTNRVPICKTLPDSTNILQDMVSRASPEVVAYLVRAGCDAHAAPPLDPAPGYSVMRDESAATHWFMRTHGIATYVDEYMPVDAIPGRSVARAMGELTPADINRPSADTGTSLLHRVARYLPERPELLRYLLTHGARLDVADKEGRSWFDRGYVQIYGREGATEDYQARLLALLDQLSVAQLRELTAPKNSLTGEPGLPIEEYDFALGQLTIYLCERGAKDCARGAR